MDSISFPSFRKRNYREGQRILHFFAVELEENKADKVDKKKLFFPEKGNAFT